MLRYRAFILATNSTWRSPLDAVDRAMSAQFVRTAHTASDANEKHIAAIIPKSRAHLSQNANSPIVPSWVLVA